VIQALPAVQRERMEERSVQDATILLHRFPIMAGVTLLVNRGDRRKNSG